MNNIFGTYKQASSQKKGWTLPTHEVTNPDISRVINSNEIQSAIRASKKDRVLHLSQKANPLTNTKALNQVNPHAKVVREAARRANQERREARQKQIGQKRDAATKATTKQRSANSRKWINNVQGYINEINKRATEEQIANQKLERQIE